MNRTEIVRQLSLKTGLAERDAGAVLDALVDLVNEGRISEDALWSSRSAHAADRLMISGASEARVVDDLISRARAHPLGIDFLREGFLASVAAEFGAHALTVEAARIRLAQDQRDKGNA